MWAVSAWAQLVAFCNAGAFYCALALDDDEKSCGWWSFYRIMCDEVDCSYRRQSRQDPFATYSTRL